MTKTFDEAVIRAVREMYRSDEIARRLFDWLASCSRDAAATTIDRIGWVLRVNRGEAVALAKRLEEAGCGDFVLGRRGQKSRFRWKYSRISLGQVASGEAEEVEEPDQPLTEEEEEEENERDTRSDGADKRPLTIAEAKAMLARSLGVSEDRIEITIRG